MTIPAVILFIKLLIISIVLFIFIFIFLVLIQNEFTKKRAFWIAMVYTIILIAVGLIYIFTLIFSVFG